MVSSPFSTRPKGRPLLARRRLPVNSRLAPFSIPPSIPESSEDPLHPDRSQGDDYNLPLKPVNPKPPGSSSWLLTPATRRTLFPRQSPPDPAEWRPSPTGKNPRTSPPSSKDRPVKGSLGPVLKHLRGLFNGTSAFYSQSKTTAPLTERETKFFGQLRPWKSVESLSEKVSPVPQGFYRHSVTRLFLQNAAVEPFGQLRGRRRRHSPRRTETPRGVVRPLLRFRRAVKTVITLLNATPSSRRSQQRSQANLLSFSQFKDELLNTRRQFYGSDLSFDPQAFRAPRESTISNEAKTILSLNPRKRTEDQLHVALLSLQQAVEAFGEFPINMQQSLVRVGWFEHYESKRVIIRQGHTADNFYFILSGTALVTILETTKTGDTCVTTAAMLGKGKSFGELALMYGAKRNATVTCKDDVELLAVGREDFVDIFMRVEKKGEPEHIRYLRTIDLLHGWPLEKVPYDDPKICLFTYFRRDVVMCRDSNKSDWVYVIKTGSCRVLKTLTATKPDVPGLVLQDYRQEFPEDKGGKIHSSRRSKEISKDKQDPTSSSHVTSVPGSTPRREKEVVIAKGLPPILPRTNSEIKEIKEDPKKRLDEVYREKHEHQMADSHSYGKIRFVPSLKNEDHEDKLFVQVQKLGPGGTFGFEHVAFSTRVNCTSVSLVSDGAEAVLINKKFFIQHLSDVMQKKLRCTIQPYPAANALQQKLQDRTNWEAYKTMTVNRHVDFTKYVHDTLHL